MYRTVTKLPTSARRAVLPFLRLQGVHTWASEEVDVSKRPIETKEDDSVDFTNYQEASQRLVRNADKLVDTSRSIVGNTVTDAVMRHSFFRQFCPGSGREDTLERMRFLASHGIGSVFDWVPTATPSGHTSEESFQSAVNANMITIVGGIECAALDANTRMAAIKLATVTSLDTLTRVSKLIRHVFAHQLSSAQYGFVDKVDAFLEEQRRSSAPEILVEDLEEIENLKRRLESLASIAFHNRVRLLMDAEESELQPAIDYVVLSVMDKFNRSEPWIWNTYQCYLKDAQSRLLRDTEYFLSKGNAFGVKLVRGAYLKHEAEQATEQNRPSRVFDTQADTDACYNHCMRLLIDSIHSGKNLALCLATHNQHSIETALHRMSSLGMDEKEVPVYFAQLYGMRDYLTYTLGHHHYKALKLLVFGEVHHVIPYLLRRAQENSGVLGGSQHDVEAMKQVLSSRMKQFFTASNKTQ